MRVVVTGVGGFIGSHTAEALLSNGHTVTGIDCFVPTYSRAIKDRNLHPCLQAGGFDFIPADLRTDDLRPILEDADAVMHLAAQPGVRSSWGTGFLDYATHNVVATQRLLEASTAVGISRFVYASSSSIYGNATSYPSRTDAVPQPYSPYGVTKLAAEHLSSAYGQNFGLPVISLRYFTVYGPRQRPDMAINRLINAGLTGDAFELYGDGEQVREFTFVDDVVRANVAALEADAPPGCVANISSGEPSSMNQVISLVTRALDMEVNVVRNVRASGDVRRTGGDISSAKAILDWSPTTGLEVGVRRQVRWQREAFELHPAPGGGVS